MKKISKKAGRGRSLFVASLLVMLISLCACGNGEGKITPTPTVIPTPSLENESNPAELQLYFGQMHSHTQYSDGAGSLKEALEYIENLPEEANVDFVAFTDHSNYFDTSSAPNPEGALYDMSLASKASRNTWNTYVSAMTEFNAGQNKVVAVPGFEMTWSSGPGHMNTFNTAGIVSRNNDTLNAKAGNAGIQAYYELLSRPEGEGSISQFNHPGQMFGTFVDFAFWNPMIDARVKLIEVANGSGAVGASGYYPSYEYYTMALDKGWHLAPTNNQDNHKGRWGNSNDARDVVLAEKLTLESIYEAIHNYRVYATEDKNLEIRYTVNGAALGTVFEERPDTLDIHVSVSDPDATDVIRRVEVIVNSGKTAYAWEGDALVDTENLKVTLPSSYDYYFIRVTQEDGDIAVTAPVWVEGVGSLGISSIQCDTELPVTGGEVKLTTKLYNGGETDATLKYIVYTTEGSKLLGMEHAGTKVPAYSSTEVSFSFVPEEVKNMKVTATAIFEKEDGDYSCETGIEVEVKDGSSIVYIGVDAVHDNEYVAGSYDDGFGKFSELAAEEGIHVIYLHTTEELKAACENPKYKALILTAPSRKLNSARSNPKSYSADEIKAVQNFSRQGGMVIVAGWSDYYEDNTTFKNSGGLHMAAAQNEVLTALGSHLRVSDDGSYDDRNNGGQNYRLYFNNYNWYSDLLGGMDQSAKLIFSQYGGATIYAVDETGTPSSTIVEGVIPVVYAHETTYSSDADGDGLGGNIPKYKDAAGRDCHLIFAAETLTWEDGTTSMVIVSGATFMSDYEMKPEYSNYGLCEALLYEMTR